MRRLSIMKEVRRINAEDGSFIIVYLETPYKMNL